MIVEIVREDFRRNVSAGCRALRRYHFCPLRIGGTFEFCMNPHAQAPAGRVTLWHHNLRAIIRVLFEWRQEVVDK